MATGIGLTVIKEFTYRGVAEEFSNHYHLTGSVPANAAAWRTLFDALVAQEKTLYNGGVTVVAGYGYDDDAVTAHAVWSVDLKVSPNTPVAGTFGGTGRQYPGDTAMWIRWKLDRLNSKGKAIYLRKYFHGVMGPSAPSGIHVDDVLDTQITALQAFATLLSTGAGVGGAHIRDTGGGAVVSTGVSTFATTRTLKRRGKRPS
jgi:hypothetical protein